MSSVNLAILIGHLGADPEIRYMPNGEAVANVSVATSESWKDKQTGEKKEQTEWHRVTFYRRLAEIVGQYLKKGSLVYVEGRLQTRKWKDKTGQDRYTTEIIANEMKMLGRRDNNSTEPDPVSVEDSAKAYAKASGGTVSAPENPADFTGFEDDVPF